MFWQTAAVASLLAGQVLAGVLGDSSWRIRRDAGERVRRYVDSIVEPVERRQTTETPPPLNLTAWDSQTMAACTTALQALNGVATNPSGTAICYNLPFLDNSTGVFQADLRLFSISAPTGDFADIPPTNIQVGLSYIGATVSPVNASTLAIRSVAGTSLISWPRSQDSLEKRQAPMPQMAQAYAFVGQINKDLISPNMDATILQKLLTPTVTLTGTDTTGATVNTTLSSSEATFVSGVFAATPTISKATVQSPIQTLVVASGQPFVVPGLNILIFPIGGIITGIWAVLFVATIAYGTYGRLRFRENYRRRRAREEKGNMARI